MPQRPSQLLLTSRTNRTMKHAAMVAAHPACRSLVLLVLALLAAVSFARTERAAARNLFSNLTDPESFFGGSTAETRSPPSPSEHGFSDQSEYVGLSSSSGAVMAVADFNRDHFIDLLAIDTSTLRAFSVLLWDHDAYAFGHGVATVSLDDPALQAMEKAAGASPLGKISAAYVGDFSNDGAYDVLVGDGTQGRLFFGDGAGAFNASPPVILPDLTPVAAVVDADADLVPDIFVVFRNGTRGFWRYEQKNATSDPSIKQSGAFVFQPWVGGSNQAAGGTPCETFDDMATAVSFADIDGDCLPDLVVPTTCGLEVWSNAASSNRPFWNLSASHSAADMRLLDSKVFNYKHGDRVVTVADFDADGTNDFAIVNRNRQDLIVHRNVQSTRAVGALCARDVKWSLERQVGLVGGVNLHKPRIGGFLKSVEVPPLLHVGDYDRDGLPDLLAVDGSSRRPVLFRNRGGWLDRRPSDPHFERADRDIETSLSKSNSDSVSATFFDTDESGRQDILVVRSGNQSRLMWNTLSERWDALFFKGTVLSSLSFQQDPRPFAPVAGNTIKISYMERGSRHRARRVCSQCAQSGFFQLSVCSCQYGLKNIANYIEELWVGAGTSTRSWTSLMPNSMAVIWGEGSENLGSWWMEYFTQRRGSQMLRVTAILMTVLVILGFIILYLQHRERKEDRAQDERESVRLFNFVV